MLVVTIFLLPDSSVRIIFGLPFVLFFPGYTLIAALYPRRNDLDGIERLALSLGLSLAVVPLIGLVLNYLPWGIRLTPIVVSLTLFIGGCSVAAALSRKRLSPSERVRRTSGRCSTLRAVGVEVPKVHDVGTVLTDYIDRFPATARAY